MANKRALARQERILRVCRNIRTQERLVFRMFSNRPHVFHNVSDASIARIERVAYQKDTCRYDNPLGDPIVAHWYKF